MTSTDCTARGNGGRWYSALLPALCLLLFGCVHALRPYNELSQQKLRIQSSAPQQYAITIADKATYSVPSDGRVVVDIPRLERGCATYLFGVKVSDASPNDVPAIRLKRNDHTVRKLSLNDLPKLPVDEQGYHLIKAE